MLPYNIINLDIFFIVFTPAAEMRLWIKLTLKKSHLFDSKMNSCLASNAVVTSSTICAYQYMPIVPGMCDYNGLHMTWWYISDISQSLILHICCPYFPSVSFYIYLYKLAQNLTITSVNHILLNETTVKLTPPTLCIHQFIFWSQQKYTRYMVQHGMMGIAATKIKARFKI